MIASAIDRIRALAVRLLRPPRSRRGFLIALAAVGGLGSLVAIAGLASEQWAESEAFCSKCHTMAPQAKAYQLSPHRDVACGECHVGPGVGGFVKAKFNGARQTLQMLTGNFPKPIPPPDHDLLPSPEDTCMECHSLERISGGSMPTKVVLRPRYREDRANTRETVAVVVRPSRLGQEGSRGAHWHVQQEVEFTSAGEGSGKIDWVKVTYRDGRTKQFVSRSEVGVSSDARPDVKRLVDTQKTRRMTCIDCHNRVGHELPSPVRAIDESIDAGRISPSLPFIKREGVARIGRGYESGEDAERAIGGLRKKYARVAKKRPRAVNRAVGELQRLYRLVATPEMKAIATAYPNNLGHQSSPGCFRCHDGGHFRVDPKGRVLDETIPWACTTCHTFPQAGREVSSVSLLGQPEDHESDRWVFDHKNRVSSLEPPETGGYCANCHDSGAALVNHDEMLYRHPQAIDKAGLKACQYCHQKASCARCHKEPVLDSGKPYVHGREERSGGGRE